MTDDKGPMIEGNDRGQWAIDGWRAATPRGADRGAGKRGDQADGSEPPRAARMNAATRAGSLRPGDDSTPLATSTIHGRTHATRAATFSGVRPPARTRRGRGGSRASRSVAIAWPVPPAWPAT